MTLDPAVLVGPFGALALLAYIAKVLWDAHRREDEARDARLAAGDALVDKLADSVRESTVVLRDLRDQERERLDRDRDRWRGPDRRRGSAT